MLEKHLIKATLLALRVSHHPYSRGYIQLLKESSSPTVALDILQELSEFYVNDWHSELKRVKEILKGYDKGHIPSRYR